MSGGGRGGGWRIRRISSAVFCGLHFLKRKEIKPSWKQIYFSKDLICRFIYFGGLRISKKRPVYLIKMKSMVISSVLISIAPFGVK